MAESVITTEKSIATTIPDAATAKKITRNQPNLSDCNACNRHINTSADRLRLLTSLWRIVLLCKRCFHLVESGNLCSYCLESTSSNSNLIRRCTKCDRGIHAECVERFSKCPPWSYYGGLCGGGGVDCVCVDCWMPKVLERECGAIRVRVRKGNGQSCGNGEKKRRKLLEEADSVARKKVAVAVVAKENAMLKAVAARNAVELASVALDLVAKSKGGGAEVGSAEGSDVVSVDDAQLAFQLHRAMNSSPRIARNLGFSDGGFRRRGKGSGCNGVSLLGRRTGGSEADLDVGLGGLSEAAVRTSSSSKSLNPGGDDCTCLDAESESCVEQQRVSSDETEQKCAEKPTVNVNFLELRDDRYLRKYSRRGSCGAKIMGGEPGCRAIVAHLKCSDQSRTVADAS